MAYRIILIRHSIPSIEENTPSIDWSLSAAGETAAINLAEYLVTFSAKEIASSPETKAYQTASLIAGRLGLPVRIDPDLHEHSRSACVLAKSFHADCHYIGREKDECYQSQRCSGFITFLGHGVKRNDIRFAVMASLCSIIYLMRLIVVAAI